MLQYSAAFGKASGMPTGVNHECADTSRVSLPLPPSLLAFEAINRRVIQLSALPFKELACSRFISRFMMFWLIRHMSGDMPQVEVLISECKDHSVKVGGSSA